MRKTYFLASSAFALPLPLAFFSPLAALAFFSPLAGLVLSFLASAPAGALGAVSDFGACANAVNANAEAINATSSFFMGDVSWFFSKERSNTDLIPTTPELSPG